MKERDIQVLFKSINKIEGVFELKLVKGSSLPFSRIEEHQIESLLNASEDTGLYHKIADGVFNSKGFGANKKPFDCFFIKNYPAYLVVCFYVPRKKKNFYYIEINDFVKYLTTTKKKSINEVECNLISKYKICK